MTITFDGVVLDRGGRRALDHVTCTIPLRGVTAIVGPSGAGKSTLLRLCNRLDVPTEGRVLVDGRDLREVDPLALRRGMGMVFQRPTPFPGSVASNLRVGARGLTDDDVENLLVKVGLDPSFAARPALELSGGEAQRMCLARALAVGPRVLLLDEPTSSLDVDAAAEVEAAVADVVTTGVAVIWVSHDPEQVARVADRVIMLDGGRFAGPAEADHR